MSDLREAQGHDTSQLNMSSLWDMIRNHCRDRPDSIACSQSDRSVTYGELEATSLSLAALFRARGVERGSLVPIFLSRSLESVASVLALLRLGACFVPMDPESWSQARINSVLGVVEPRLVITTHPTKLQVGDIPEITVDEVQRAYNGGNGEYGPGLKATNMDCHRSSEEPVYIIFTSGTTGTPKGVVIPRRCVENYVRQGTDQGMPFNMGLCPKDSVLLLFSLAFDGKMALNQLL